MGTTQPNQALEPTPLPVSNGQLLLWALLATITMLFAGFASAYLVRQSSADWISIPMPQILWGNTAILILSSFTLELARGRRKRGKHSATQAWLWATLLLGLVFVAGQLTAWRQLVAQGIYLPGNPHNSFFYILTGLHGLHLLGGIVFLLYALARTRENHTPLLGLCATYWHFLGGLWLFLVYLLFGVQ